MLKVLELQNNCPVIKEFSVLDFKKGENFYFLKLKVIFIDNSELYAREFVSATQTYYSYHWQNSKTELIIRWDNAPHHKHLKTFPHHKHTKNKIVESNQTNIKEVIDYITQILQEDKNH